MKTGKRCSVLIAAGVFFVLLFLYIFKSDGFIVENIHQNALNNDEKIFKRQNFGKTGGFNEDDLIVVYNRVPKTASTSFMGVAYDLCKMNKYNVLHLNVSKNSHVLGLADQTRFVKNVTNWTQRKPAIYHGHLAFLDFSKFGQPNPIYINLIREPLDRLISYYYFLRYGDDFRPHLVRKKAGNKETFDECVSRNGKDCDPSNMWLQIPFFCGHSAQCWIPGNKWALEEAKRNLIDHYLLVGVTEELRDFLIVLEATLPRFFSGATNLYLSGKKSHLRKTAKKIPPTEETVSKIKQSNVWQMENEFYEFAKTQFHYVKSRLFENNKDNVDEIEQENILPRVRQNEFFYEKIKPS